MKTLYLYNKTRQYMRFNVFFFRSLFLVSFLFFTKCWKINNKIDSMRIFKNQVNPFGSTNETNSVFHSRNSNWFFNLFIYLFSSCFCLFFHYYFVFLFLFLSLFLFFCVLLLDHISLVIIFSVSVFRVEN